MVANHDGFDVLDRSAVLDPDGFVPSPLHGATAFWPDTNCALDMYVEMVRLAGHAPEAAALAAVSSWFQSDGWISFELQRGDLQRLYGLEITEFTPWQPVVQHVQTQLANGRLLTLETDAWWLPDTREVSYHQAHVKTGIVPLQVDASGRKLLYLHNSGMFRLSGDDFDGVFSTDPGVTCAPRPYVEMVRRTARPTDLETRGTARQVLVDNLAIRQQLNPVEALTDFLAHEVTRLQESGDQEGFHRLAFVTTRQLGSSAQMAAGGLTWLDPALQEAASELARVSDLAKAAQFGLARAARGRRIDLRATLGPAAEAWQRGLDAAAAWANA